MCATGLVSVAYYYFDFKDAGKQNRRGLLSSLLTQLCTRSHHCFDILSNLYEEHENGSQQPKEVDLIQCLKDVLALPGHGRVYIVVDAVDESPNKPGIPSPREKVLQLIEELVNLRHSGTVQRHAETRHATTVDLQTVDLRHAETAALCHPDIRLCITSRPEVDIRTALETLASHTVSLHDERGQRRDIINYIESVVESDPNMRRRWRAEDRQLIINSLSENAHGM